MATDFVQQAASTLNPIYDQQYNAVAQQVPAIQNLYNILFQGLEGQRQTETQNILESASQRGVLRSSLPVDLQTTLAQTLLAERGKLSSQHAQELAGVSKSQADIQLSRAQGIQTLADSLFQRDLQEREFQMKQQAAERQFQLDQQRLRDEAAARASAGRYGGGGGGRDVSNNELFASALAKAAGKDGKVSPGTYNSLKNQWVASGYGDYKSFHDNFWRFVNTKHWWDYK